MNQMISLAFFAMLLKPKQRFVSYYSNYNCLFI
jgi:hypothetical protein